MHNKEIFFILSHRKNVQSYNLRLPTLLNKRMAMNILTLFLNHLTLGGPLMSIDVFMSG
jgi:hypothetical protein